KGPNLRVPVRQQIERCPVAGIGALPHFQSFDLPIPLAGNSSEITRGDVEFFAFTGAVAKLVGFLRSFPREFVLMRAVVAIGKTRKGAGKILIQLNRVLVKRNGLTIFPVRVFLESERVGLQCFERWRSDLLNGRVELLN